jgi:hypothetical protein
LAPGIPAQLCVWTVWILSVTGWLPQIHQAFHVEDAKRFRRWLLSWGLVFPLEVQLTPDVHVQLSWLWLAAGFLVLLTKSDLHEWGKLLVSIAMTGVVFFLIREWSWTRPSFTDIWVHGGMLSLLWLLLWTGHKNWIDRTVAILGGLLIADGIWLMLHHQMFRPLQIGHGAWMDMVMLFLAGWLTVHMCGKSVVDWVRVRLFRTTR